jgi:hypothetical protein
VGALLLFDISGFFDNINPKQVTQILQNKGFPANICDWTLLFLSDCKASLKIGPYESDQFDITTSIPQGSPLSPILSTLYTANLLENTQSWQHQELTLYVDDGAIYTTGPTTETMTNSAIQGLKQALGWLHCNGLTADPSKTELMIFTSSCSNPDLIGGTIKGARYNDPITGPSRITTTTSL